MHKVRRLRSSCTCAKCHPGLCSLLIDSEVPIEDLLAESVGPDQTAQTLFRMANSVDPDQTPQNATQFALNTGISIKHGNTNQADSPSIGKRTCPKSWDSPLGITEFMKGVTNVVRNCSATAIQVWHMSRGTAFPCQIACSSRTEDLDQPAHPGILIRTSAARLKKVWMFGYPQSAKQWLWSACAFAQADLSHCFAGMRSHRKCCAPS